MRLPTVLLVSLLLAACGSMSAPVSDSPVASGAKLWYSIDDRAGLTPDELGALTERLEADLAPVRVPPGTAGAHHLKITVTSYRMLQESGRAVVGMVADTDHIASIVQTIDPSGGRLLAEKRILTRATRSLATGDALARAHGGEISGYVASGD